MDNLKTLPGADPDLIQFLYWVADANDLFYDALVENLARYPVDVRTFVTEDKYLGLKNVYPAVLDSLDEIFHPKVDGFPKPIRLGTTYKEVILTGGLGCGKTYLAVLGILYSIYLLSCFRNPHAIFGLDPASEIVFLFQSIRFQTGGVAYKLAREIIEGSTFFTHHFPRNQSVKNEILLPNNIVIRPVSGDQTAAIGMNVASVLLDEMSYMKYHSKSLKADDGGEYDQATSLYSTARTRIDSRFSKYGKHLIPMFLAGSARHEDDFIQGKLRETHEQLAQKGTSAIFAYNKKAWEVKPWDFSGDTFRVFPGKGTIPPRVLIPEDEDFESEFAVDIPVELELAFRTNIRQALRDHAGIPSSIIGTFIIEVEKSRSRFTLPNIFEKDTYTFLNGDFPKLGLNVDIKNDAAWFLHIDFSHVGDNTAVALGYLDKWDQLIPRFIIPGIIKIPPVSGQVIPWDQIRNWIYYLSDLLPICVLTADQKGDKYLIEHFRPYGFRVGRISNDVNSSIFHDFHNILMEGNIELCRHEGTIHELMGLNEDGKTGKVEKGSGGSDDCIDAVVSVVAAMKSVRRNTHDINSWNGIRPRPPTVLTENSCFSITNARIESGSRITFAPSQHNYSFAEDDGQILGSILRGE